MIVFPILVSEAPHFMAAPSYRPSEHGPIVMANAPFLGLTRPESQRHSLEART